MSTTTPTIPTVASTILWHEHALQELGVFEDLVLTPRQQEEWHRRASWHRGQIATLRMAERELAEVEPQVERLTTWRDHLLRWRRDLIDQLQATWCDDPRRPGLRYSLELSIRRIDVGLDLMNEFYPERLPLDDLMAAAGYAPYDAFARARGENWLGTLPVVEARLKPLVARRDDALTRRDQVLADYAASRSV